MYEINYAYNEYDNRYTELAPTDLIKQLFDKMDDRNILFVPDHPYRRGQFSEGRKWLRCEMKWTAEDRDEIIDEFESLYTALEEVAAAYPELSDTTEDNRKILSAGALEIWRKYCTDLGDGLFEKEMERNVDRLIDSMLIPELSELRAARQAARRSRSRHLADRDPVPADEEMFIYWKHNMHLKADIRAKFGYGPFAFDCCIRLKRLYYMMAFNAPQQLISREAKRLASYMTLDRYCTWHTSIEQIDALALPLKGIRNVEAVRDILADTALYDMVDPEDDMEPAVANWSSVYYLDASDGEKLIEAYDLFNEYEPGCHIIAESLSRDRKLDPEKIDFRGAGSSALMGAGWPDFIYYPCRPEFPGDRIRRDISEQEILETLQRFADTLGVDPETVGRYKVPV